MPSTLRRDGIKLAICGSLFRLEHFVHTRAYVLSRMHIFRRVIASESDAARRLVLHELCAFHEKQCDARARRRSAARGSDSCGGGEHFDQCVAGSSSGTNSTRAQDIPASAQAGPGGVKGRNGSALDASSLSRKRFTSGRCNEPGVNAFPQFLRRDEASPTKTTIRSGSRRGGM